MEVDYKPLVNYLKGKLIDKNWSAKKIQSLIDGLTKYDHTLAIYYINHYSSKYSARELTTWKSLPKLEKVAVRYARANYELFSKVAKQSVDNLISINATQYISLIKPCAPEFTLESLLRELRSCVEFLNIDRCFGIFLAFRLHYLHSKELTAAEIFREVIMRKLSDDHFPPIDIDNVNHYYIETINKLFSKTSQCELNLQDRKEELNDEDIIEIHWKFVTFEDGCITMKNPQNPKGRGLRSTIAESKKSYQHLLPFIESKLPPIRVMLLDGELYKVVDKPLLSNCVISVARLPKEVVKEAKHIIPKEEKTLPESATREEIEHYLRKKNSQYLNYLCEKQAADRIFTCHEKLSTYSSESFSIEEAFIFTLKKDKDTTIVVYENISDSRCSVLFEVDSKKYNKAIKSIADFFSSSEMNKREKLQWNRIKFDESCIKKYVRILHNDFYSWRHEISRYLPDKIIR